MRVKRGIDSTFFYLFFYLFFYIFFYILFYIFFYVARISLCRFRMGNLPPQVGNFEFPRQTPRHCPRSLDKLA